LFIGNIGRTEFLFKNLGFFTAANDLEGDKNDQNEQEPWFVNPDEKSHDEEGSENIDRISNARVKSRGDEGRGFCLHTEGSAELKTCNDEEQKSGACDGQADDMGRRPRHAGCLAHEEDGKDENDGECDEVQFHMRPLLSADLRMKALCTLQAEEAKGASGEMVFGLGRIMAMPVISIRAGQHGDEDELAELRALLWPDGTVVEHRGEVQKLIQSGMSGTLPAAVLVAIDASEGLAGFLEVGLRSHADGCDVARAVGYVEGWFVREEMRGQGIGKQLMKAAEDWSRAQNCREIASDALMDNMESREAHSALGFEVVDLCVHFRKGL